jgi:hypothetical protein
MTTWLGVWTRAVIGPAYRRASAVWAGCMIVAAIIFGPTAMHPRDITQMALDEPSAFAVLAGTWLLVFVPIARALLHGDEARYLRSLPAPALWPRLVQIGAIVGLQLPWLLLWLVGEHVRGLLVFAGSTIVIALVAWWRPSRRTTGAPRWRSSVRALVGVYVAALVRRAGDALVRGAGLAIFAGLAAGLFVRNNVLAGEHAARIAASVIALMAVPAQVGVLGVLLDAHRRSTWLARSLGVLPSTRTLALGVALAIVHVAAALLAVAGTTIVLVTTAPVAHTNIPEVAFTQLQPSTLAWITVTCVACAVASAIGAARVVIDASHVLDEIRAREEGRVLDEIRAPETGSVPDETRERGHGASHVSNAHSASASTRMAIGSLVVSVATIAALALFGALAGAAAILVVASFFLARHPRGDGLR